MKCPYRKYTLVVKLQNPGWASRAESFEDCYGPECIGWDKDRKKCAVVFRKTDKRTTTREDMP